MNVASFCSNFSCVSYVHLKCLHTCGCLILDLFRARKWQNVPQMTDRPGPEMALLFLSGSSCKVKNCLEARGRGRGTSCRCRCSRMWLVGLQTGWHKFCRRRKRAVRARVAGAGGHVCSLRAASSVCVSSRHGGTVIGCTKYFREILYR